MADGGWLAGWMVTNLRQHQMVWWDSLRCEFPAHKVRVWGVAAMQPAACQLPVVSGSPVGLAREGRGRRGGHTTAAAARYRLALAACAPPRWGRAGRQREARAPTPTSRHTGIDAFDYMRGKTTGKVSTHFCPVRWYSYFLKPQGPGPNCQPLSSLWIHLPYIPYVLCRTTRIRSNLFHTSNSFTCSAAFILYYKTVIKNWKTIKCFPWWKN